VILKQQKCVENGALADVMYVFANESAFREKTNFGTGFLCVMLLNYEYV
jgi:hypothetical protein